jgi:hypothetical protein
MTVDAAKAALGGGTLTAQGGEDMVNALTDFHIEYVKSSADSMATDATSATMFWCNPYDFDVVLVSGKAVSASTLTAHDTNYATITVQVDDGANGTPVAALTWTTTTTGTGNWAADTAKANTATASATVCTVAPGACVHFAIAKASSGVAVPASRYIVRCRRRGD